MIEQYFFINGFVLGVFLGWFNTRKYFKKVLEKSKVVVEVKKDE